MELKKREKGNGLKTAFLLKNEVEKHNLACGTTYTRIFSALLTKTM